MEENRKQQLAISCSKPSASGEVAPSFAGNDDCNGDETEASTPAQFLEGTQSGKSTHENPTVLRLEELTSMDPTVEVGFEIADSFGVLKLTNSSNPEMERAGEKASRRARLLQKGAKTESQQILRSANSYDKIAKIMCNSAWKGKPQETANMLIPQAGYEASIEEADTQSDDYEVLVNEGVYGSVKCHVASGKGTKVQTSSTAQAASQTQSTNQNGAS